MGVDWVVSSSLMLSLMVMFIAFESLSLVLLPILNCSLQARMNLGELCDPLEHVGFVF